MSEKPRRDMGALAERWADLQVVWKLLLDGQVSPALKAIPLFAILYLFFPFDLLPDIALGLGQLDDVGIILLALTTFIRLAPSERVEMARRSFSRANDPEQDVTRYRDEEDY